ncbi:TPA: hypothetical protein ACH3X3_014177 [Trebouxia sp. C0006]
MAPSAVWLITGASRGIGAELAKQVLSTPNTVVFASARSVDSAKRLHELQKAFPSRLHLISMDVVGSSSIQAAVQAVTELTGESGVDYLVNNAGTAGPPVPAHEEKIDTFRTILEINVLGVHAVSQAFLPLLKMGHKKTVINMSSCLGSHAFLHAAVKPSRLGEQLCCPVCLQDLQGSSQYATGLHICCSAPWPGHYRHGLCLYQKCKT